MSDVAPSHLKWLLYCAAVLQVSLRQADAVSSASQLVDAGFTPGKVATMILEDDDPMWLKESGGHQGPEWGPDDRDLAATQDQLPANTYLIHQTLVDHPGQMLSVPELIELTGNRFKNAHSVASVLGGYVRWCEEHDRILPFSWWQGRNGEPTKYAMKPKVAALFREARNRA